MIRKYLLPDEKASVQLVIQIVFGVCLCTFILPTGSAQQSPERQTSTATNSGTNVSSGSSDQYLIGAGDELSISVFGKAELSRDERVDERGTIRMPLIDDGIRAACRTENEVAEEIARMYRDLKLLKSPIVSVSVKDYQSQPVAVLGAINAPGRFLLHRRVRLLELLVFHAGGPTAMAGRTVQILSTVRGLVCKSLADQNTAGVMMPTTKAEDSIVTYDLKELLKGNKAMNPYVQPGDIINVLPAEQAIVVGNVRAPAAVPLVEPTTLSRAIAMVGGLLTNTKKDKIRILRPIPGSTATNEFLVDLKAADKTKGENFILQGGDIVEVSAQTGLKAILANIQTQIAPTLTALPYRVIP